MQRTLPCACDSSEAMSDGNIGRFSWNVRHEFDPTVDDVPSSSNPCWRETSVKGACHETFAVGDCVSCCGFRFVWNKRHQNAEDLEHLRQRGDALADAALAELFGDGIASKSCPAMSSSGAASRCKRPSPAAGILEAVLAHSGPACCALVADASAVPAWVNWDEVHMGQKFFVSRLPACAASLLFFSLVGGFGAPLISQVLARTGYLGGCTLASADESTAAEATWKRVLETAVFVCEMVNVMADPTVSFQGPNGTAWRAIMRVRLLHAMVRRRILQLGTWDTSSLGVPINQQDMRVTNLAFSQMVIISVERLGVPMDLEDMEAYLHLWRLVGYILGVDEDVSVGHLDGVWAAQASLESSIAHLFHPDDLSKRLSQATLRSAIGRLPGKRTWHDVVVSARVFQGDALSDALDLPEVPQGAKTARANAIRAATTTLLSWSSSWLAGWWIQRQTWRGFRFSLFQMLKIKSPPKFDLDPRYDPAAGSSKEAMKKIVNMEASCALNRQKSRLGDDDGVANDALAPSSAAARSSRAIALLTPSRYVVAVSSTLIVCCYALSVNFRPAASS